MHKLVDPAILYFGTPVVLVSSSNEDGSPNLAPISSAWWLGRSCMLGFGARSKTPQNVLRTRECVLNLPSVAEVAKVNRLALLTGSNPVPPHKVAMGYRHEADKFGVADFTPVPSTRVAPPRVAECPVQLEAVLRGEHPIAMQDPVRAGNHVALEVEIVAVHIDDAILDARDENRIDPTRWRPLIMSFREFFGLGDVLQHSTLSEISDAAFRPRGVPPEPAVREMVGAA